MSVTVFSGPASALAKGERRRNRRAGLGRIVGRITEPRFVREGTGGEIRAVLEIINPAGEFGQWLVEAVRRGMHDNAFGLSIVASSIMRRGSREVREIVSVESVDFVVRPSAGGRILRLIESVEDSSVTRPTNTNTDDHDSRLTEAVNQVKRSRLPKPAQKRVRRKLKKATDLSEAAVSRLIESERSHISKLNIGSSSGTVTGLGDTYRGRTYVIEGREERIPNMLDALLDPEDRSVVSLKRDEFGFRTDVRGYGALIGSTNAPTSDSPHSQRAHVSSHHSRSLHDFRHLTNTRSRSVPRWLTPYVVCDSVRTCHWEHQKR